MILGGIQLVMTGLLGEMLSRTYHESQNKPTYVIREILDADEEPASRPARYAPDALMSHRFTLAAVLVVVAASLLTACGGSTPTTPTPPPPTQTPPPQNALPSIDAITAQGRRTRQPARFADLREAIDVAATVRDTETSAGRTGVSVVRDGRHVQRLRA